MAQLTQLSTSQSQVQQQTVLILDYITTFLQTYFAPYTPSNTPYDINQTLPNYSWGSYILQTLTLLVWLHLGVMFALGQDSLKNIKKPCVVILCCFTHYSLTQSLNHGLVLFSSDKNYAMNSNTFDILQAMAVGSFGLVGGCFVVFGSRLLGFKNQIPVIFALTYSISFMVIAALGNYKSKNPFTDVFSFSMALIPPSVYLISCLLSCMSKFSSAYKQLIGGLVLNICLTLFYPSLAKFPSLTTPIPSFMLQSLLASSWVLQCMGMYWFCYLSTKSSVNFVKKKLLSGKRFPVRDLQTHCITEDVEGLPVGWGPAPMSPVVRGME